MSQNLIFFSQLFRKHCWNKIIHVRGRHNLSNIPSSSGGELNSRILFLIVAESYLFFTIILECRWNKIIHVRGRHNLSNILSNSGGELNSRILFLIVAESYLFFTIILECRWNKIIHVRGRHNLSNILSNSGEELNSRILFLIVLSFFHNCFENTVEIKLYTLEGGTIYPISLQALEES